MPDEEKRPTKEESLKENSNYLRSTIKEELENDLPYFQNDTTKILKFHGTYQQDNRDTRQERAASKQEKEYISMIRTKLPGGKLTPEQYLSLNAIAEKYGNNTLRITTRQTIQLHGVVKGNLYKTINEINKNLILTYGACGDVVRNVITCPVCDIDPEYGVNLNELAGEISNYFLPKTSAYYEIWVDGEKIDLGRDALPCVSTEPLYGKTYLPRKFKIGLSLPNDNCIDLFIQDLAIVPQDRGFNIFAGGGLGFTHNKPQTYPRLASPVCFVTGEKLMPTLEKIVTVHRDFGGRSDRRHARLKYVIDDHGLDWFKKELEKRLGFKLELPKEIKEYKVSDHLGWHRQINNKWYLGLFIENGRICDRDGKKVKSGLKEIVEKFKVDVRLSTQQNIVLANIDEKNKDEIDKLVDKFGIYTVETRHGVSLLRRFSMACPALPTCGLAMAEAERALPHIIDELEKAGFKDEKISIRMSGCPNSCSRPPVAEIGIIGLSLNKYNIYLGGSFEGTRLNKIYKEGVATCDIVHEIAGLLKIYREKRQEGERFGDFWVRTCELHK